MVNDIGILVVGQTRGNATRVAPRCVMMDSRAQPVMISKKFAQELGLATEDLAPVHSPLSHPLVTWSGLQIILESHYSLAFE